MRSTPGNKKEDDSTMGRLMWYGDLLAMNCQQYRWMEMVMLT